jgi:hypothetical protein
MAPAITAMASIFRMFLLLRNCCAPAQRPARNLSQCVGGPIVPGKRGRTRDIFRHFLCAAEPVEATGVCYRGTAEADKMRVSIRHFPTAPQRRDFK